MTKHTARTLSRTPRQPPSRLLGRPSCTMPRPRPTHMVRPTEPGRERERARRPLGTSACSRRRSLVHMERTALRPQPRNRVDGFVRRAELLMEIRRDDAEDLGGATELDANHRRAAAAGQRNWAVRHAAQLAKHIQAEPCAGALRSGASFGEQAAGTQDRDAEQGAETCCSVDWFQGVPGRKGELHGAGARAGA